MSHPSTAMSELLFVGIQGNVVALRKSDGSLLWSTALRRGSSFVPLLHEGGYVYAVSGGEVSCLDARSGELVWHNKLEGYGMDSACLAGSQGIESVADAAQRRAAATVAVAPMG